MMKRITTALVLATLPACGDAATVDPNHVQGDTDPLPPPLFAANSSENCGGGEGVGSQVPDFRLPTPSGESLSASDYRGRVVLLNFWGTWCAPCLEELPEFSRLYVHYRNAGLTLVAVATDEDPAAVDAVAAQKQLAGKLLYGGEALAETYGDRSFPFTFLLGPDGEVVEAYDGYERRCLASLESSIREQLASL